MANPSLLPGGRARMSSTSSKVCGSERAVSGCCGRGGATTHRRRDTGGARTGGFLLASYMTMCSLLGASCGAPCMQNAVAAELTTLTKLGVDRAGLQRVRHRMLELGAATTDLSATDASTNPCSPSSRSSSPPPQCPPLPPTCSRRSRTSPPSRRPSSGTSKHASAPRPADSASPTDDSCSI